MSENPTSADLIARLTAVPGVDSVSVDGDALWAEAPRLDVAALAAAMAELGLRFVTTTATPLGPDGETTVIHHWVSEPTLVNVRTRTRNGRLDSLAAAVPAASWAEREITDLLGVAFAGHPDPTPLLLPAGAAPGLLRAAMAEPRTAAPAPVSPLARP
ncbi:NADH-quinone oxidoreductase subunit C [Azospirillum halopraeferens]|uniref:NADH-quinone oxidoreductase subunit C n=1 Tax=Azospirillum halopraeferens TaxID=34010 RepID=UPI0004912F05|nr:NADH-quinone oxidoreductase subunit C [Azospirillum halopraeferens]